MIRHARTVTMTVFCALAVSAVAAPGAFASNATAYKCTIVAEGTKGEDCRPGQPNEGFGHVAILVGETT